MRYLNRTSRAGRRWMASSLGVLALVGALFVVYRYTAADQASSQRWRPHPGRVATLNLTIPRGTPVGPISAYIAQVDPEVIAFQEACVNKTNRIVGALKKRGMDYTVVYGSQARVFGRCGLGDGQFVGASGNALLLANGVTGRSGNVPYKTGVPKGDEQRGYVYAQTTVNGSPVTVFGTQLSQHTPALAGVRTEQVSELAEAAGVSQPGTNSIVLGDFNTVPNEAVLDKIRTAWVDADPGCNPRPHRGVGPNCTPTQVGAAKKLDYIWLKPRFYPNRNDVTTVRTWPVPQHNVRPRKEIPPPPHEPYTDHDLVYTDLRPAVHPKPSGSQSAGKVTERKCRRSGETTPCVDPYLLTAAGTGQLGQGHDLYVAPRRMFVGSNFVLDKLSWKTWGGRSALATGRMAGTDCVPNCAEGTAHDYGPAEVEVFHLASTSHHGKLYTCARVRKPGEDWGSVDPSLTKVCVTGN